MNESRQRWGGGGGKDDNSFDSLRSRYEEIGGDASRIVLLCSRAPHASRTKKSGKHGVMYCHSYNTSGRLTDGDIQYVHHWLLLSLRSATISSSGIIDEANGRLRMYVLYCIYSSVSDKPISNNTIVLQQIRYMQQTLYSVPWHLSLLPLPRLESTQGPILCHFGMQVRPNPSGQPFGEGCGMLQQSMTARVYLQYTKPTLFLIQCHLPNLESRSKKAQRLLKWSGRHRVHPWTCQLP